MERWQEGALWVRQQFGVEARPGQGAAQFVADGQQQRALGFEHLVDVPPHGVQAGSQVTQLAGVIRVAGGDRLGEVSRAKSPGAGTDGIQRLEQMADVQPPPAATNACQGEKASSHWMRPLASPAVTARQRLKCCSYILQEHNETAR